MAGRYNHVSNLGNWQGEHPFTIVHGSEHVPPDEEWRKAFFGPQPVVPTLVAEKGYASSIPFPYYYLAADGWRNTLTDVLWDGVK